MKMQVRKNEVGASIDRWRNHQSINQSGIFKLQGPLNTSMDRAEKQTLQNTQTNMWT